MKARRYCDGGACDRLAAWLASFTKNNGERSTTASCARCLPQMKNAVILGIQESLPLNWLPFDQDPTPVIVRAGMAPVPLDNDGSMSILDERMTP